MKKVNRCKFFHKYSSKKIISYVDSSVWKKNKGRHSKGTEEYLEIIRGFFSIEITVTNESSVEERKIEKSADVLDKTELIWRKNDAAVKDKLCLVPKSSVVTPNVSEEKLYPPKKDQYLEIFSSQKQSEIKQEYSVCETQISKKFIPSTEGDNKNITCSLTEKKSFVPEVQSMKDEMSTNLSRSNSKTVNLDPFEEYIHLGNLKNVNQILDEDSAYGSGESLPGYSPEPRDVETSPSVYGYKDLIEKIPHLAKYEAENRLNQKSVLLKEPYPNILDQDTECICENSDCDSIKPVEFQEFLNGVDIAKPRIVRQAKQICAICNKEIVDEFFLSNRFGLLLNCNHPFCYHCIFSSCYRSKTIFPLFKVSCPVCGELSPGIVSSSRWIQSRIKKANLFRDLQSDYIDWKIMKSNFENASFKRLDRKMMA